MAKKCRRTCALAICATLLLGAATSHAATIGFNDAFGPVGVPLASTPTAPGRYPLIA